MKFLGNNGIKVSVEKYFRLIFKIHEHDAIAELWMARDYASAHDQHGISQPKSGLHAKADWQGREHLNVAAAATEVGGFEAGGDKTAFWMDFDLHLDGVTRILAAIISCESGCESGSASGG